MTLVFSANATRCTYIWKKKNCWKFQLIICTSVFKSLWFTLLYWIKFYQLVYYQSTFKLTVSIKTVSKCRISKSSSRRMKLFHSAQWFTLLTTWPWFDPLQRQDRRLHSPTVSQLWQPQIWNTFDDPIQLCAIRRYQCFMCLYFICFLLKILKKITFLFQERKQSIRNCPQQPLTLIYKLSVWKVNQ